MQLHAIAPDSQWAPRDHVFSHIKLLSNICCISCIGYICIIRHLLYNLLLDSPWMLPACKYCVQSTSTKLVAGCPVVDPFCNVWQLFQCFLSNHKSK